MIMAVCDPSAAPVAVEGSIDSLDPCKCGIDFSVSRNSTS